MLGTSEGPPRTRSQTHTSSLRGSVVVESGTRGRPNPCFPEAMRTMLRSIVWSEHLACRGSGLGVARPIGSLTKARAHGTDRSVQIRPLSANLGTIVRATLPPDSAPPPPDRPTANRGGPELTPQGLPTPRSAITSTSACARQAAAVACTRRSALEILTRNEPLKSRRA